MKNFLKILSWYLFKLITNRWFLKQVNLTAKQRKKIICSGDPVRYGTIQLAIKEIKSLVGDIAECGVYKGQLSRFLHEELPQRELHLFDTFNGFDTRDLDGNIDNRFKDTSAESVYKYVVKNSLCLQNVFIHKGYFPETTIGLEDKKFALVIIDFDKGKPSMAALNFFYSRMVKGGYIFVHDYNNPESDYACYITLCLFLKDKPEKLISIPDTWGSAVFRKI